MNARLCVRESINVDFISFCTRSDALCVHGALIKAEYLYATLFSMLYWKQEKKPKKIERWYVGKGEGKYTWQIERDAMKLNIIYLL